MVGHGADAMKIAAIFPMTGEAVQSSSGVQSELLGTRQAVDELNRKGGLLGRKVLLMEYDNKSTALGSKTAAQEAVKDRVIAVVGSSWSSLSLAMTPVLQAARIPMITPISTSPELTLAGDYIFRACFTDPFQGSVMADFARTDLRARTAVVLTNTGETYCMGLAKFFISQFTHGGGEVLWEGDYLATAADFTPLLKKVQMLNPNVVFVPGMTRDSSYIIRQARKMGIKTVFLGGDGWDSEMYSYAGPAIEGSYFSGHWHPQSTRPQSRRFMETARKLHRPQDINSAVALSYDAVMLLADAIRRAGSPEPARIRAALAATRNFKGVTGDITFDKDRNPLGKEAVILTFAKGTVQYVKTIKPSGL
jgi:branched-chain amino acid transport system substrate-binding protein